MIFRKEVTDSTNRDARTGRPGDVFTAEFQTAGRGRLDHVWSSAKSENLMFSMVLAVGSATPAAVATLPLVVGLAVARVLEEVVAGVALKWPNDVLVGSRKLCGILCERQDDTVIAGVGVNVNQTSFPPELSSTATSLAIAAGHPLDRDVLLEKLVASLASYHERWRLVGFAGLQSEYAACDFLRGRTVVVRATDADPAPISGVCGGVQSDGSLRIGDQCVYAGESHVCAF